MTLSPVRVLCFALLAGLVAALVVACFHFVATEPLVEQAINLETQRHMAEGDFEEPLLSRDLQRVGLFIGFLMYGATWALLFTAAYAITQRWLPGRTPAAQGAWLAALGFWALALVPFLRYPASPPGVGNPDTIELRQQLYVAVLLIGILGAVAAVALDRQLLRRGVDAAKRLATGGALLFIWTAVVLLVMPGSSDATGTPPDLILRFRILSLLGLALFWALLGAGFAALAWWTTRQRSQSRLARPVSV